MQCPSCASDVPDGSRFCGACGSSLDLRSATTRVHDRSGVSRMLSSLPAIDEARFAPGTIIAERYRIVELLGRGGMGEVYRADDLKLEQPVALKFLPRALAEDADRLTRFLNEVKIARQVSHPSVCRMYDVGEAEGHHFLSMEYVDGEDLASLLRRIGRLPEDKAVQICRQLCAGLAAAHELGIVHRDIKPSNVMVDGKGRARLTDFGLAGLAESFAGPEVRAGTPTYMAPEQLSGKEATPRSDIYALGLVMYELFTGKRAWDAASLAELRRLHEQSTPTRPASFIDGFDPAVERVIFHCLEQESSERPGTALAVAAALPGGDPLAAALAAGETPSPEMVAAAGPAGGMRPGVALACALGTAAMMWLVLVLGRDIWMLKYLPFDKSYAALQENAREIAQKFGYTDEPAGHASWFALDAEEYFHSIRNGPPDGLAETLGRPGQMCVGFLERQGSEPITPTGLSGRVSWNSPTPEPGEVALHLDLRGRLIELRARPPRVDPTAAPAQPEADWAMVFQSAGLDLGTFTPTAPTIVPETYADARFAWRGVLPDQADRPVRIEAASYRGQPVYFEKIVSSDPDWEPGTTAKPVVPERVLIALIAFLVVLIVLVVGGGVLLTMRNLRLGRGDRRGALRIACVVAALRLAHWALGADHVAAGGEITLFITAVSGAVTLGVLAWVVYMAFEPYVRRLWPESIVSWTRLLAGRVGDPLVGRDVLYGCTLGMLGLLVQLALLWVTFRGKVIFPNDSPLAMVAGGRFAAGELFALLLGTLAVSLGFMLLFLLVRIVVRKTWIATAVLCLLQGSFSALNLSAFTSDPLQVSLGFLLGAIGVTIGIVLPIRFGLVALLASQVFVGLLVRSPMTLDPQAPYFTTGLLSGLACLAIPAWGLRVALAGRPLFSRSLLDN